MPALVCLERRCFLFRQLRKRIMRPVFRHLCRSGGGPCRVFVLLRELSPLRFCTAFKVFLGRISVVKRTEIRGIDGVNGIVGWIQGVKIDLIARVEHDILADLGRGGDDVPFTVEITIVFGVFEQQHSRQR